MKKYSKDVKVELPHSNHATCPIYKHNGKYYIKANKPNTMSYEPFRYENEFYTEVVLVGNYWFTK